MAVTVRSSSIWRWAQYSTKGPVSFCRCISSDVGRFSKDKSSFEQPDNKEWKSVFSYFYSSYNMALNVNSFFNSFDLSPAGLLRSRRNKKESRFHASQAYIPERVRILGGDLAAAHFITFRKGKVRFCGNPEWVCYDEKNETVNLPKTYTAGYVVEALDLSKMLLTYEGIENLKHLEKIEWLSLENNPYIDDWCLDRLTGYFKDSLTYLNINGCQNVTEKGIASLSRLRKLKNLQLGDHPRAQNLELVCVMLEELLPELRIQGVVYCDQSLLDNSSSQN